MNDDTVYGSFQVISELYACIDGGRAGEAVALFTPSATYDTANAHCTGIEAIAARMQEREQQRSRQTRHIVSNLRVTGCSEASVELTGTLQLYILSDPTPTALRLIAEVNETLQRQTDGHWLISSHRTVALARQP